LQEFLSDRHVQHSPKNPQLLMNCGCLEYSLFSIAERGLDSDRFSQPFTEVKLDIIRRDVHQFARSEGTLEMLHHAQIDLVGLLRSDGRRRVVLEKEIRPLIETQVLPFSNHTQDIVISGMKPFP
jgi:hypothetical protein